MPSTFSTNLKIELIANGEQAGVWGETTNTNLGTLLEEAIVGRDNVAMADANQTITISDGTSSTGRRVFIKCLGGLTANRTLTVPTINKNYVVENATTGGFSITVKTAAGSGVSVGPGKKMFLYVDSTNVVSAINSVGTGGGLFAGVYTQVFTASGTYTPHAGLVYAIIECVGGGAAGGGAIATASTASGGGGGGAGSYARRISSASDIGASQTVTIGAGGAGVFGNTGGNGGDTSVGSLCIGKGGTGGAPAIDSSSAPSGGTGGVAGTGNFTPTGESGGTGVTFTSVALAIWSGNGGNSIYGGGGKGAYRSETNNGATSGGAATNYGSGGGGAVVRAFGGGATGGAGSNGVVIITEFCDQ